MVVQHNIYNLICILIVASVPTPPLTVVQCITTHTVCVSANIIWVQDCHIFATVLIGYTSQYVLFYLWPVSMCINCGASQSTFLLVNCTSQSVQLISANHLVQSYLVFAIVQIIRYNQGSSNRKYIHTLTQWFPNILAFRH